MLSLIRRAVGRQIMRHLLARPVRVLLTAPGPSTLDQLTDHTGIRRQIIHTSLDVLADHGWLAQDPFHTGRYRVTDTGRTNLDYLLHKLGR